MLFSTAIITSLIATAFAGPIVQKRQDRPNPNEVYIKTADYRGTGCPAGSASIQIQDSARQVVVLLQEYFAEAAPGLSPSAARKNCQINLDLHYPGGFSYSILKSQYRGFVEVDQGVTATHRATYYFAGETKQAVTSTDFRGPKTGDYLIADEIPTTATIWAPCGRVASLNINTAVSINTSQNREGRGIITNDSQDHRVEFVVGVQWRRC